MKGYLPHTDFDYAAVEGSDRPIMDDEDAIAYEVNRRLPDAVSAMFRWVVSCRVAGRSGQATVGRRFIALAWVVNPALFEDGPSSTTLAKRIGLSRKGLQRLTGEVSRTFSIINTAQRGARKRRQKALGRALRLQRGKPRVQPQNAQ